MTGVITPVPGKNIVGAAAPLAGLRVVDFTEFLAGPYCAMILAALGADVVKVERLTGDPLRRRRPNDKTEPVPFHMAHRNKSSLPVDVQAEEGREVVRRLTATSHVLVQNFRPGVVERLGLDWSHLREVNRELVYCSISGFGSKGPYAGLGGFDLVAQTMAGIMSVTGDQGGTPVRAGYQVSDIGAGMWSAIAILAARTKAMTTGEGDHIEVSLFDGTFAWSIWTMSEYLMKGIDPAPMGNAHRGLAPFDLFDTKDGRLAIAAGDDVQWPRVCDVLGVPELVQDPRFAVSYTRYENRGALRDIICPVLLQRTAEEWQSLLQAKGIPCGQMMTMADLAVSEQVAADEMLPAVDGFDHPTRVLGSPMKFSESMLPAPRRGPVLAEGAYDLLRRLGYERAQITDLDQRGVIRLDGVQQ
jgi:crotonobetainyl-CoA:carnitine CoA-transferase CaiB-like acyl-CoA transferase